MRYVGENSIGSAIALPDEAGVPRIHASRCPVCGDVRVPFRPRCPLDLTLNEPLVCSGLATVYEVVKVSLSPPDFSVPFWVGFVDLEEGARVFAQVAIGDDGRPPAAGDQVVLALEKLTERDGEEITGPMFRTAPAK